MKKILAITSVALLGLGIGLAAFLAYMGMFSKVTVSEKSMGPYTMVYEDYQGPYQETGKIFMKVYQQMKKEGINPTLGLGIYYDDPRKVDKSKLRCECGLVVPEADLAKVNDLKTRYQVKTIAQRQCLVAAFPLRNALSYSLGPMKGYPALMQAAQAKGYTMDMPYELDDMQGKMIYYVAPIKQGAH